MRAHRALSAAGIPAEIVNTPRETGYGCGISLALGPESYAAAASVLGSRTEGFAGWWLVTDYASGKSYSRL